MARIQDKVAIITGGAFGIGLATVKLFLQEGAKVVLVDYSQEGIKEVQKEINSPNLSFFCANVSDPKQVKNFVSYTIDTFGKIDIVFCNAGVGGHHRSFWEYPDEDFEQVIDVNLKGVFYTMKYATPHLISNQGGSIIITSSVAGLLGMPKGIAYSASKHACIGLSKSAALELAKFGIRVNTIHPAWIETPMVSNFEKILSPNDTKEARSKLEKSVPMRRYGQPDEVAQLVLFLASDESKFITGSEHKIDGGLVAS
ncbi:MAG: SDR family oxidoreductase [Thermoflexibacter sp.]|jgi:NAD(P)-dependent dehydrogenase (short-subunit alcohol dehydrogenase family)|nr:SDR family oxidoreductase [Thermoflexibacter sp.]